MTGAFDLANRSARQTGDLEDTPLFGAGRDVLKVASNRVLDRRVGHNQSGAGELGDESFGVIEAWEVPGRAVEPKRATCCIREDDIVAIAQLCASHEWHERAE